MLLLSHLLVPQAGLDALVLVRYLWMGLKMSLLGCVLSLVLIPVYRTAPKGQIDLETDGELAKWSLGKCVCLCVCLCVWGLSIVRMLVLHTALKKDWSRDDVKLAALSFRLILLRLPLAFGVGMFSLSFERVSHHFLWSQKTRTNSVLLVVICFGAHKKQRKWTAVVTAHHSNFLADSLSLYLLLSFLYSHDSKSSCK